jgi:hypothetical protein
LTEAQREIMIKHCKWSGTMLRLTNIRNHIIDQVHAQRATKNRQGGIKDIDASYKSAYKNILYIGRKCIYNDEWFYLQFALEDLMRRECARTIMGSAPTAAVDAVITMATRMVYRGAGFEMLDMNLGNNAVTVISQAEFTGYARGVISQAEFTGYARFERVLRDSLSTKKINFDLNKVYGHRQGFTTIRVAEAQAAASFVLSAYTVDDIAKFAEERIAFMDETIAECQQADDKCYYIMSLMKECQRFKELVAKTF